MNVVLKLRLIRLTYLKPAHIKLRALDGRDVVFFVHFRNFILDNSDTLSLLETKPVVTEGRISITSDAHRVGSSTRAISPTFSLLNETEIIFQISRFSGSQPTTYLVTQPLHIRGQDNSRRSYLEALRCLL